MLDALFTAANHHLHLSSNSWPPELVTVASTVSTAEPGIQHLNDIHSWQLLSELWGLQIAKLLPICQWECGNGKGLLDGALAIFCSWRIVLLSSVCASSPSRYFRSCTFWPEIYLIMVLSIGSSCWVVIQSFMYRFTCAAQTRITVSWTCFCFSSPALTTTGS